jgi:hypothetical protein
MVKQKTDRYTTFLQIALFISGAPFLFNRGQLIKDTGDLWPKLTSPPEIVFWPAKSAMAHRRLSHITSIDISTYMHGTE